MPNLDEVFGIRTRPVLSYVERTEVDARFQQATTQDSHIVIYGSSKQGKTALRQKHIADDDMIVVRCGPNMSTESVYRSILRQSGIRLETTNVSETGTKASAKTRVGFKALIPIFGGGEAEVGGEIEGNSTNSLSWEFVGYDLGEAQAIGELLQKAAFAKYVVLENFHYLQDETQRSLAFDLKTFHEMKVRFVILGIWQEANLLLFYNSDLQDRIVEIPVEPWTSADFDRVIATGCGVLNIQIDPRILAILKQQAYGNIGLLQEFLRVACEEAEILKTQDKNVAISDIALAQKAIDRKLHDQKGQLLQMLQNIAAKSRMRTDTESPLLLPYYLVMAILRLPIDNFKTGVTKQQLQEFIRGNHHRNDNETPRTSDITNLVIQLPIYQKEMSSPFLHYNSEDKKIRIVDMRYFFVLANTDRNAMLDEIPLPTTPAN
ncbi:MAG TPA: hypothetical protein VG711_12155 [Phycisphaerales bacterium]|nr:hypothetical protein [Phycisphaerales bacterium]